MLQGFKTVLWGAILAVIPALTQYTGAIDWSFLGPVGGLVAGGISMIFMRILTKTPIFQKG